jgi:transposase
MSETKNFRDYNQSQGIFRTITPQELLEPEHPARILDAVVERLDLKMLYDGYSEEGAAAYHPKMMLKVLFYSYLTGTMSCRGMWSGLKNRADYIFLSGDQVPDFRTINRFRITSAEHLPKIFSQIVHVCAALGMVGFEHLAIDGQKIQANASFRKTKNKQRYLKSLQRVEDGMKKLLEAETDEDFTEEVKKKRLVRLQKQKTKLENAAKLIEELQEGEQVNLTDEDAVQMKHKDGRSLPSYNHQSAVDGKMGVTVAVKTNDDAFDHSTHLLPLVDTATENTEKKLCPCDGRFRVL